MSQSLTKRLVAFLLTAAQMRMVSRLALLISMFMSRCCNDLDCRYLIVRQVQLIQLGKACCKKAGYGACHVTTIQIKLLQKLKVAHCFQNWPLNV